MSSRQLDEKAIFHLARRILDPEDRATYLDQVCSNDAQLRERIEALLQVHEQEQAPLSSDVAPTEAVAPVTESSGQQIGCYKLREQIGEGGMGVVFVAEQERPIQRKVALKIIKPGMDSKEVIARFEAERQALAMMNHPNIAKVLDAGCTANSRPFFVMELVKGIPITEYADRSSLPTGERLQLFVSICRAVQHAHQKGVIHRDLKPSNVLVTEHDGSPVAKIIDFGVAKAINQRLTEQTIYTRFQQMVGTPMYMSPEQAELSGLDVDTRTDVYSLGVLLYELLTGTTPFDKERFQKVTHDEMRRIIRDEDPAKPSTRITSLGESASSISARRRTDVRKLHRLLRGDLDWIVMKAIEKDRSRRYESANGFARDVERFLQSEPVEARSPSFGYRFQKFARRNRAAIVSVCAVSLALVLGLCLTTVGFLRARVERDRANDARSVADQASLQALRLAEENAKRRQEAESARDRAEEALREAERQKNRADELRQEAEYGNYILQINLAGMNLRQGNVMVARPALLSTPVEQRNWEWGYLVAQAWPPQVELEADAIVTAGPELTAAQFWAAAPGGVVKRLDHGRHIRLAAPRISPDGTRIATTASDGKVRIWDARSGNPLAEISALSSIAIGLAFNSDGRYLATGDVGGVAWVLDTIAERVIWSESAEDTNPVATIWFSPDDSHVVLAYFGGKILVREASNGHLAHELTGHAQTVQSVRFSTDGTRLFSSDREGVVRTWNLATGEPDASPRAAPHGDQISFQTIGPNRRVVATGSHDGELYLWDLETGQVLKTLPPCLEEINDLRFSDDETCLFVMDGRRAVRIFDLESEQQIQELPSNLQVPPSLHTSADGKRMASNSRDGVTSVWAPVLQRQDGGRTLANAHSDIVIQAAYSRDGKRIVTASYDKTARVWDAATQELLTTFEGHDHELLMAAFSPDGQTVASVSVRGTVRVWDAETGREVFAKGGGDHFLRAAASERGLRGNILGFSAVFASSPFAPSGNSLVVYDQGQMVVLDSRDGSRLAMLQENPDDAAWPVHDPTGERVATITYSLTVTNLWELSTGNKLHTLSGHDRQADWVEFSADGSKMLTSSMDGTTILWDAAEGTRLQRLVGHEGNVPISRFSPDATMICTASADGTARVWDATTGQQLSVFTGHSARLTNVAFSPDGRRVLSTALDNIVCIWDPVGPEARELVRLEGASKLIYGTWSPSGQEVLTCWADGSVRLFEAFPWTTSDGAADQPDTIERRVKMWRGS